MIIYTGYLIVYLFSYQVFKNHCVAEMVSLVIIMGEVLFAQLITVV